MKVGLAGLVLIAVLSSGCGYHTAGHVTTIPTNVQTIAIPAFVNQTQTYKIEQTLTAAVVREMVTRTRYHIVNSSTDPADATLSGTVLSTSTAPLTYDSQTGRAASVLVTVSMKLSVPPDRIGDAMLEKDTMGFDDLCELVTKCVHADSFGDLQQCAEHRGFRTSVVDDPRPQRAEAVER